LAGSTLPPRGPLEYKKLSYFFMVNGTSLFSKGTLGAKLNRLSWFFVIMKLNGLVILALKI
jgi:hypothetical protein